MGRSAEVFEAAVDRFGWSVAGAGPVEVGQHVDCTLGQGSVRANRRVTVSRATSSQPQRAGGS